MGSAISLVFNGRECFAKELTARQLDQVLGGPPKKIAAAEDHAVGETKQPVQDEPGSVSKEKDVEAVASPQSVAAHGGFHIFDLLFHDEPISSYAVTLSTGITLDELNGDVSPVELETVMKAVKEANPFLVRAVNNGARMALEFEERLKKIIASRSGGQQTR